MSSLLQNVLASRLAQATLASEDAPPQKEEGAASSSSGGRNGSMGPPATTQSREQHTQALDEWENVDSAELTSDDELVGVMSLPGTVPGTPHISRPPSPGGTSRHRKSGLSKGTSSTLTVGSGALTRKSKTDPLRSLPKEVSQRIFLSLPVPALISLSMVNRRYRRSATLNYCWYQQVHKGGMEDGHVNNLASSVTGDSLAGPSSSGAKWTRRASKMDWKVQYAKQRRMEAREAQRLESLPGSGATTPSRTQRMRDEGVRTTSEVRQDEWREQESQGFSKEEMREWYKSQGGTKGGKLKGKRAKGGPKTGADDGSLWQ